MSKPIWFRSLYWRIAFGFIALLAVLLLAQSLIFLWLTDRFVGASARTPAQLAETVASDLGAALTREPDLTLDTYVETHFKHIYQPFLVTLLDGRRASNRPTALPMDLRLDQPRIRGFGPPPERFGASMERGGSQGERERFTRRGPGGPRHEVTPIMANGSQVGSVVVPLSPPPVSVALRELGPTLTWSGLGVLGIGAAITALLIFRPTHKRLRTLEQAATALGEGRTAVRASEKGGDEVSSLARTFNRMAADLEIRAAALADSDRARRQLLADVSHELMTPLSAIRGYVETLQMPELVLDDPTRRRYLGIVEQETHKLEAIIGDLLDLARLEGGGETVEAQPVHIQDLFARVIDRHEPTTRERHIDIALEIVPGTPDAWGNPARLEQAIQNVAANAIRHTPEGGRVTLAAAPAGDRVRITVRDTGPGIPAEHLPRVFDRFYKVDASRAGTAVPSGSGLGLSIVQAIVERHGGTVRASNATGGGALFELLLPAEAR
jgi:signal transduction histidine kinase